MFGAGAIATLAACATPTPKGFDQVMAGYVGEGITTVVRSLGAPTRIYDMQNGDKIYIWVKGNSNSSSAVVIDDKSWTGYSPAGKAVPLGGGTALTACRIDLTVNSSLVITAYRFEGDRCVAPEKR